MGAITENMADHAKWQEEKIKELEAKLDSEETLSLNLVEQLGEFEETLNIERIINSELYDKVSKLEEVLQYSAKVVDTGAEINNELKLKLEKAVYLLKDSDAAANPEIAKFINEYFAGEEIK